MNAQQTYYTSSRKGISGHAGFGFRTCSEGISPDELREIGALGEYRVSRDLDPYAPAGDIAAHFPTLKRFTVLNSGRSLLIHSVYTGRDYSGRTGNFLAHGLILEPQSLKYWPIDYFEWNGWRGGLTEHEDTDQAPPPLPTLDLDLIPAAESFALEELRTFLADTPRGCELLSSMIRAALLRAQSSRPILIRDTRFNAPFWIACIQKSFPRALAGALTFNSYQYDNVRTEAINVTVGDTNFRIDDNLLRFEFFGFDQAEGRASEVPEIAGEYSAIVAGWMAEAPGRLAAFHAFMDTHFHLTELTADILYGLRLFQLSIGAVGTLGDTDLLGILDFADRHTRRESFHAIHEILASSGSALGSHPSTQVYSALLRFLGKTASATGDPAQRESAVALWLAMFDDIVLRRHEDAADVLAAKQGLYDRLPGLAPEMAAQFLGQDHRHRLISQVPRLPRDTALIVVVETLDQLHTLGQDQRWFAQDAADLLVEIITATPGFEPLFERLLAPCASDPRLLARAAARIAFALAPNDRSAEVPSTRLLAGALHRAITRHQPGDSGTQVRVELCAAGALGLLGAEWSHQIEAADDPTPVYRRYAERDLAAMPNCAAELVQTVKARYFSRLAGRAALAQAREWLDARALADLPEPDLARALRLLNDAIALRRPTAAEHAASKTIRQLAKQHKVELSPDRGFLLDVIQRAGTLKPREWQDLRETLPQVLNALMPSDYETFLDLVLPLAIASAGTPERHGDLIDALAPAGSQATFFPAYRRALGTTECRSDKVYWIAVGYWLPVGALPECMQGLRDQAYALLADAIYHLPESDYDTLLTKLEDDKTLSGLAPGQPELLLDLVEKRGRLSTRFGAAAARTSEALRRGWQAMTPRRNKTLKRP